MNAKKQCKFTLSTRTLSGFYNLFTHMTHMRLIYIYMYIKVHGLRKGVNIKGGIAVKEYARRVVTADIVDILNFKTNDKSL